MEVTFQANQMFASNFFFPTYDSKTTLVQLPEIIEVGFSSKISENRYEAVKSIRKLVSEGTGEN